MAKSGIPALLQISGFPPFVQKSEFPPFGKKSAFPPFGKNQDSRPLAKFRIRRLNLERSIPTARINFLAAAWLQKHVGIEGVMEGVRIYQASVYGAIHLVMAFKDTSWLEPETASEST